MSTSYINTKPTITSKTMKLHAGLICSFQTKLAPKMQKKLNAVLKRRISCAFILPPFELG